MKLQSIQHSNFAQVQNYRIRSNWVAKPISDITDNSQIKFISFGKANDPNKIYDLNNKNILITGGTGTLGLQILDVLLKNYKTKQIVIFSRDEMKQHKMKIRYQNHPNIKFIIGDVRNLNSLQKAFKNIDVVIHTAAMKHVPICESNPEEAVKTNIDGIRNIIDATLNSNVKRVLAVSSDKAASPSNLYGATKFVGEKLIIDANKYTNENGAKFSCVRMGNILGSRGSIIPLFKEQRKKGVLKITDEKMRRFFMTPQDATNLILTGIESMNGGEIFIPKVKNTSIVNIAKKVAPNTPIEIIGARAGEKLNEEFITPVEAPNTIELKDKYIILPAEQMKNYQYFWLNAKKVPNNFNYASNNNKFEMSDNELGKIINQFI